MNEYAQIAVNVAPAFLFIALVTAGVLLWEAKVESRRLASERDDLADELEVRHKRSDELVVRRHERLRAAMADGAVVVPEQGRRP